MISTSTRLALVSFIWEEGVAKGRNVAKRIFFCQQYFDVQHWTAFSLTDRWSGRHDCSVGQPVFVSTLSAAGPEPAGAVGDADDDAVHDADAGGGGGGSTVTGARQRRAGGAPVRRGPSQNASAGGR